MPGVKRAHAEDAGARVDAKRARGSTASSSHPATSTENVTVTTPSPAPVPPLPPRDELGFETDEPVTATLAASAARCEDRWRAFVWGRTGAGGLEERPDDVREHVRSQ